MGRMENWQHNHSMSTMSIVVYCVLLTAGLGIIVFGGGCLYEQFLVFMFIMAVRKWGSPSYRDQLWIARPTKKWGPFRQEKLRKDTFIRMWREVLMEEGTN